jgi:hypothetical protein
MVLFFQFSFLNRQWQEVRMSRKVDFIGLIHVDDAGLVYPASFEMVRTVAGLRRLDGRVYCEVIERHATGCGCIPDARRWQACSSVPVVSGYSSPDLFESGDHFWISESDLHEVLSREES